MRGCRGTSACPSIGFWIPPLPSVARRVSASWRSASCRASRSRVRRHRRGAAALWWPPAASSQRRGARRQAPSKGGVLLMTHLTAVQYLLYYLTTTYYIHENTLAYYTQYIFIRIIRNTSGFPAYFFTLTPLNIDIAGGSEKSRLFSNPVTG